MTSRERERKIRELRRELKDIRSNLPMHSVKPEIEYKIMQLEDEIHELRQNVA